MPIPQGSVQQQDTLIAPIIQALITVAGQINGLGNRYAEVPEAPPEHGSVLFAPLSVRVQDDETNGKLVLKLDFNILHLFRRVRLQQDLALISAAIPAWLTVLTAWSNQTLGGLVQNLDLTQMDIKPYKHAGQDYLALSMTVSARPIINIVTTP